MMAAAAAVSWILAVICLAGCHLSSASPVLRSALVVPAGQNVSLTCNLTSSGEITWYLLHQDELQPLLTVSPTTLRRVKTKQEDVMVKLEDGTSERKDVSVTYHTEDARFSSEGDPESGEVLLQILQVEEQHAGLYFCTGRCAGSVCVNRGLHLVVDGADGASARRPCLSLGICLLPPFLLLFLVFIVGFCLCSGKPAVSCCRRGRRSRNQPVTEEVPVHYSSLKHADKPRPPGRGATGLVEKDVTYSAVMTRKNLK